MTDLTISPSPRPLGKSGLSVFPIAYGMWRFAGTDVATARAKIDAALETAITLFDTADIYGLDDGLPVGASEELFGKALAEAPSLRDKMVIATKAGIKPGTPYDSGAKHLRKSCEECLARMGIDTIDLFQIHRPDLLTHPGAVAETLQALRDEGKIRFIGVSNHTVPQIEALQAYLDQPIATSQPELSAWTLDPIFDGHLDHCMASGLGVLAWSPLAGGRLALTRKQAKKEENGKALVNLIDKLDEMAEQEGLSREAIALAWLLAHPANIIPIIGTQKPKRIARVAEAFDVQMSKADWYAILQVSLGETLP